MGYSVYYDGELSVAPPLTEADDIVVRAVLNGEHTAETLAVFAAIAASSEPDLPWHAGLLMVSEERDLILPEEDESRHGLGTWLRLVLQRFLSERGYVLNGQISWEGEDADDRGTIFVKDNQIEIVDDLIFNAGPSWNPNPYASDELKQTIRELLDSADSTGCSPDLTVVMTERLEAMRSRLPQY